MGLFPVLMAYSGLFFGLTKRMAYRTAISSPVKNNS